MLRYIGLMWDPRNGVHCATVRNIASRLGSRIPEMQRVVGTEAVEGEGAARLSVHCAGLTPGALEIYPLQTHDARVNSGTVIGKLFPRALDEGAPAPVRLTVAESTTIVRGGGRHLLDHYWGSYVAFVHDSSGETTFVVRDPTGGLPCLSLSCNGVTVVFSHMQDLATLDVVRLSVNWDYVCAYLMRPGLIVPETGLNEVEMVLQGQCLEVRPRSGVRKLGYWNPIERAQREPIEDLDTAARLAKATTRRCVNAWASCYPRIVHKLSGGLDSSIVLACLRRAPTRPDLTCVNFYDDSPCGDERQFAQWAVEETAAPGAIPCRLIEYERKAADVRLGPLLAARKFAYPQFYNGYATQEYMDREFIHGREAAFFDGGFGDQLFFPTTRGAATDYAWLRGLDRNLFRIAFDCAVDKQETFARVLFSAVRDGLFRRAGAYRPIVAESLFAAPEIARSFAADSRYLRPYWLTEPHDLPPQKLFHIDLMSVPADGFNPFDGPAGPDRIMPLESQPLVELFLRIPVYVLAAGGQDRAVPRQAFADDLAPQVLARRSKGIWNGFRAEVYRRNEAFLRDLLLDGILVTRGFLVRQRVERFLSRLTDSSNVGATKGFAQLLEHHLNLEIWLRSWGSLVQAQPADPEIRTALPATTMALEHL